MNINQVGVNGAGSDPTTQQSDKVTTNQSTAPVQVDESLRSAQPGVIVELGKPKEAPVTYSHLKSQPVVQSLGNGLGKPPPTEPAPTTTTLETPAPAATTTDSLEIGNGLGKPPPTGP